MSTHSLTTKFARLALALDELAIQIAAQPDVGADPTLAGVMQMIESSLDTIHDAWYREQHSNLTHRDADRKIARLLAGLPE